ncbi:histidine phosphatase family protein [Sphingomonas lenta]|uniref:Histidine phosphatase family protein n=1 Tax=Sphingomonas lenta TaxID=1141887 RepID=A0A2A2SHD1_9SPHN|nr:histidine phosphatase family protein [Sphingomonas lenta]PAX08628.1 histidine phosphatase family protein [Sphingomonas lenta]
MAATLILVRHAAHVHLNKILSGRTPGVPLSEAGRAQAMRLAAVLAERRPALVQTSPIERAERTAIAIADAARVGIERADALVEIDFGKWTGTPFEELNGDPDWDYWNAERATARPPSGESMGEAQARIVAHLAAVAAEHDGETVVLVSHADMIRAAVAHVLGLDLGGYSRFDIGPASATTLVWGDWGAKLVALNEGLGA